MSANLVVDLQATVDRRVSVAVGSGSDLTVGQIVDLMHANTFTNLFCAGAAGSGVIEVRVQTSDLTTSGSFTDPTSGIPFDALPSKCASGGVFFFNSGLAVSGSMSLSSPVSNAPVFCSGGIDFGAFLRPGRYARLITNSGPFPNNFTAGFIVQKKTIGSGGGFSYSPGSGTVNV